MVCELYFERFNFKYIRVQQVHADVPAQLVGEFLTAANFKFYFVVICVHDDRFSRSFKSVKYRGRILKAAFKLTKNRLPTDLSLAVVTLN